MIAIVPARGGSKGLPRKNVLPFAGQPLITHTLVAAKRASRVSRVIVTTDDDEIMEVCRTVPGVEVPFRRPNDLARDASIVVDAFFHLIDWLADYEGLDVAAFCVLQPTSPLRLGADIDGAVELFQTTDALAVLSVTESKPLAWHHNMAADGRLEPLGGERDAADPMEMRQKHAELVVQNGAVHVFDTQELRRTRSYYGPRTYGYGMPFERSIDIDTAADFALAERIFGSPCRPGIVSGRGSRRR